MAAASPFDAVLNALFAACDLSAAARSILADNDVTTSSFLRRFSEFDLRSLPGLTHCARKKIWEDVVLRLNVDGPASPEGGGQALQVVPPSAPCPLAAVGLFRLAPSEAT